MSMESEVMYGKGVWKLNVELLEDEGVKREYVEFFWKLKRRRNDFLRGTERWKWVKGQIRFFCKERL